MCFSSLKAFTPFVGSAEMIVALCAFLCMLCLCSCLAQVGVGIIPRAVVAGVLRSQDR